MPPSEAASEATAWLASNDDAALDPGVRLELALGLLAGGDSEGAVRIRDELTGSAERANSDTDADTVAKLIVLTAATDGELSPANGPNLIGTFGDASSRDAERDESGSATGPAWQILAYRWAAQPVPQSVIDQLDAYGDPDGSGAYGKRDRSGFVPDAGTTAIVIMALSLMGDLDRQTAAVDWLASQRGADGSYPGPDKINSTGLAVAALTDLGRDESAGRIWLVNQQLADGGLPTTPGGGSDLVATSQGVLGLAGNGYATLDSNGGSDLAGQVDDPADTPALDPQGPGLSVLVGAVTVIGIVVLIVGAILGRRDKRAGDS